MSHRPCAPHDSASLAARLNPFWERLGLAVAPGASGDAGFSVPRLEALRRIEVTADSLPELEALGLRVAGGAGGVGVGNRVFVGAQPVALNMQLVFGGRRHNTVILDAGCRASGVLRFEGDANLACVGGAADNARQIRSLMVRGYECLFFIGRGGSMSATDFWLEGERRALLVGDDPLFSWNIHVRNADSHGLVDLASGALLNPPQDVVVGPHVWVGQDCKLMKGVRVGAGAVLGAGSVVTRNVPPRCAVAGVPARVLRRDVSWTRQASPDAGQVAEVLRRLAGYEAGEPPT